MVVFVGVYAAFALSEYRVAQEAETHRDQIHQALIREIEEITVRTRRAAAYLPNIVAFYDSSIAVGAMPALEPMIEPIRARSHGEDRFVVDLSDDRHIVERGVAEGQSFVHR